MPRRKKETIYTKLAPHIIPFSIGFSLFLSLFLISLKIYSDNFRQPTQQITKAETDISIDPDIVARTIHWDSYTDTEYPFSVRYPPNRLKNTNDAPLFAKAGVCTKKEVQALTLEPIEFNEESLPGEIYSHLLQVTIHVDKSDGIATIEDWFQLHCLQSFDGQDDYVRSNTALNGREGIEIAYPKNGPDDPYITGKRRRFILVGQYVYIITTQYSLDVGNNEEAVQDAEDVLNFIVKTVQIE